MAQPAIDSSSFNIGGPCKITDPGWGAGAIVMYTEGDVQVVPTPTLRGIPSSLGGEQDDVISDLVYKINFTPKSIYAFRTVLAPTAMFNWLVAGPRLVGSANRSVVVLGSDGQQYTFQRAAVTRPPDIFLGVGRSMWGAAEYTAFLKNGAKLADADAFFVPATAQAWSQADYASIAAAHYESVYSGVWGAITGFSAVFGEDGFNISHQLQTEPVKMGNVTVDLKITGYRAVCAFNPVGPTEAQLRGATQFDVSRGIGQRLTSVTSPVSVGDFVLNDGVNTVTLGSVAFQKGQFVFDSRMNRYGQWAMVTALTAPVNNRLVLA